MTHKFFTRIGLWVWILLLSIPAGGGEAPVPAGGTDSLIRALMDGNREQAAAALEALPSSLPQDEIRKIVQALNRLNPGADWIPFLQ